MMVSVLGAHGSVARLLTPRLLATGHSVRGVVRSEDQFDDLRIDGAEPVLCDLERCSEDDLDRALAGSDAVVFAAGAGAGSGPERKRTLDRDGAIAAIESATRIGADHFVLLSAMGADDPPDDDETFSVYLRAKAAADRAARDAPIDETIIRPGRLTDDPPSDAIHLAASTGRGEISRTDVAAVLAAVVDTGNGRGCTLELVSGERPVDDAVTALGRDGRGLDAGA